MGPNGRGCASASHSEKQLGGAANKTMARTGL
jgi:hypothetical protein